jgi:hypothetical protein
MAAAPPELVDVGWIDLPMPRAGRVEGPFAVTTAEPVVLRFTDYRCAGDRFEALEGESVVGVGSPLMVKPSCGGGGGRAGQAFFDGRFSAGVVLLPPGSHELYFRTLFSFTGTFLAAFRIDTCTVVEPTAGVLRGTKGDDVICGGADVDTILGRGGTDVLVGGGSGDVMVAARGRAALAGGGGADSLIGGAGRMRLFGGAGSDSLQGDTGSDGLVGAGNEDVLVGKPGDDVLHGGRAEMSSPAGSGMTSAYPVWSRASDWAVKSGTGKRSDSSRRSGICGCITSARCSADLSDPAVREQRIRRTHAMRRSALSDTVRAEAQPCPPRSVPTSAAVQGEPWSPEERGVALTD